MDDLTDGDDVPMDSMDERPVRREKRSTRSVDVARPLHRAPRTERSSPERSGTEGSDQACFLYAEMEKQVFCKDIARFSFMRAVEDKAGREEYRNITPPDPSDERLIPDRICDQHIEAIFGPGTYRIIAYGSNGRSIGVVRISVGDKDAHVGSGGREGRDSRDSGMMGDGVSMGVSYPMSDSTDHQDEGLKERKAHLEKMEKETERLREDLRVQAQNAAKEDKSMMATLLTALLPSVLNPQRNATPEMSLPILQMQLESERAATGRERERAETYMKQWNAAIEEKSAIRNEHRDMMNKNDDMWRERFRNMEKSLEDRITMLKDQLDSLNGKNIDAIKGKIDAETETKILKANAGDKPGVVEQAMQALPMILSMAQAQAGGPPTG